MSDGRKEYHFTITVSFGDWNGGSTQPYIPFRNVEIDLSQYSKVYSITPSSKAGGNNDRFFVMVIGMTSNKHYLVGCYTTATYVNPFTNGTAILDIIAE